MSGTVTTACETFNPRTVCRNGNPGNRFHTKAVDDGRRRSAIATFETDTQILGAPRSPVVWSMPLLA